MYTRVCGGLGSAANPRASVIYRAGVPAVLLTRVRLSFGRPARRQLHVQDLYIAVDLQVIVVRHS